MSTQILVALIAAIVTAGGWVVTNIFERKRDRSRMIRESRARYLERQVEELYGPLFNLTMQIVTTNHVRSQVVRNTAPEQRAAIDQLFYREYFRPLHDAVRELLKTKLHLVEGSDLPESFYTYLRHSLQERVQQDLWHEHQIDTSAVQGIRYPDAFTSNVQGTLEVLLVEYNAVITGLHSSTGWLASILGHWRKKSNRFTDEAPAA